MGLRRGLRDFRRSCVFSIATGRLEGVAPRVMRVRGWRRAGPGAKQAVRRCTRERETACSSTDVDGGVVVAADAVQVLRGAAPDDGSWPADSVPPAAPFLTSGAAAQATRRRTLLVCVSFDHTLTVQCCARPHRPTAAPRGAGPMMPVVMRQSRRFGGRREPISCLGGDTGLARPYRGHLAGWAPPSSGRRGFCGGRPSRRNSQGFTDRLGRSPRPGRAGTIKFDLSRSLRKRRNYKLAGASFNFKVSIEPRATGSTTVALGRRGAL